MQNGRPKVFNFQMSKLDTKIINEMLEDIFNQLDFAAKSRSFLDLFFVMSERENIGINTHTKTILCSKKRNYFLRKRIWLQSRKKLKTLEHKVEVQVDNKCHFFRCITKKKTQWDVRTLSCVSFYYDIRKYTIFYRIKISKHTKIIYAFSVR